MSNREVVVVSGARTAIGDYGGSLKEMAATKLGATAIKEAVARSRVAPESVGHVVMGSVIHGEAKDMYLSRVAAVEAGIPVGTPALTVNRLCGSGLQAIVSASQHILLGDCDVAVAGGAESMSRAAYFLPTGRWGQRMGDAAVVDAMVGALHDPFGHGHMGVTAENIAAKYGFTRQQQDQFSVESHRRAARAMEQGLFNSQIVPIELKTQERRRAVHHRRARAQGRAAGGHGKLKAGVQEGRHGHGRQRLRHQRRGAALVLWSHPSGKEIRIKPMARLVAYAHAGVEPQVMGLGPIPAVRRVFEKAGLKPADMDVVESNEAFAVQAMAVTKDLGLDPAKVNPNGGAVALGHPIGATGAILTVKALYELERTSKRYRARHHVHRRRAGHRRHL
jgi:acetyl-CoA C-acetyltransferase